MNAANFPESRLSKAISKTIADTMTARPEAGQFHSVPKSIDVAAALIGNLLRVVADTYPTLPHRRQAVETCIKMLREAVEPGGLIHR